MVDDWWDLGSVATVRSDDRQVAYREWALGSAHRLVIDLHGGPGCRLIASGDPDVLREADVSWVTIDRPGLGGSDPQPGRCVADWARDVERVVDHLGFDQFSVVGWSMGGPYAAATAAVLGSKVMSLTLLAPAPVTLAAQNLDGIGKRDFWELARDDPWTAAQAYLNLGIAARTRPADAIEVFSMGCSEPEVAAFADPALAELFIATLVEATRQGPMGLVDDMRVEMAPWGFDPAAISVPTTIWEATDDTFALPGVAQGWADTIEGATVRTLDGEGHLFPPTHTDELLDSLLA
jgi:pimeloyl-ACP methyl ester carboxylesterase